MKPSIIISLVLVFNILGTTAMMGQDKNEKGRFQGNIKGSFIGVFWNQHYTIDASFGWRFNEKNYIGAGTGCHLISRYLDSHPDESNGLVPAVPLFGDYIRYFPFIKQPRHAFFVGIEVGGAYCIAQLPLKHEMQRFLPYANAKAGLDFGISKRFGFTVGINLIGDYYPSSQMGFGVALNAGLHF